MTQESNPNHGDKSRHDAFARLLCDSYAPQLFAENPSQYLMKLGFSSEDTSHILQQDRNIIAYHAMLRNSMRGVISAWLPRCRVHLGHQAMQQSVDLYLAQAKPKSPCLRLIPQEFVKWAEHHWKQDQEIPDYAYDLARYDILEQDIRNDPRPTGERDCPKLELDRPVCCNQTCEIFRSNWQVNLIPRQAKHREPPPLELVQILVFRGLDENTNYIELSSFTAHLFELIQAGHHLQSSLELACQQLDQTLNDIRLREAALALAGWMDKGAIFGSRVENS